MIVEFFEDRFSPKPSLDFSVNRKRLKQCKKIDSAITMLYVASLCYCVIPSILSWLGIMFTFSGLVVLVNGVLFKIITVGLGFWGCYGKRPAFAVAAPAFAAFNWMCLYALLDVTEGQFMIMYDSVQMALNISMLITSLLLTPVTIVNTLAFRQVEQAPGYPYFNDLWERQKEERMQFDIKNEFEESYERHTRNTSEEMFDIDSSTTSTDNGAGCAPSSYSMDEI